MTADFWLDSAFYGSALLALLAAAWIFAAAIGYAACRLIEWLIDRGMDLRRAEFAGYAAAYATVAVVIGAVAWLFFGAQL